MKAKKQTPAPPSAPKPELKGYFAKAEQAVKKLGITDEQRNRMLEVFTDPSERKTYRHGHSS